MNVEIRDTNGKKKYYLAYTYRSGTRVKKVRVYLGADLSNEELRRAIESGEIKLLGRIHNLKEIEDPYLTILSKDELEELKKLDSKAAIKLQHLSEENWQKFTEIFTYNTNAIEGSAVEDSEVKDILENNKWPDRSKEDISETIGVAEAVDFIRKTKEHISISLIKELHRLAFKNSKPFAGKLREVGMEVGVYDSLGNLVHRGAASTQVLSLLKKLVEWYKSNEKHYPALLLAAVVHNQFENIHPFADGNGRVGRLLLINILLKHGMPPVNIELENRQEYYAALQNYEKDGNIRPTLNLLLKEYRKLRKALRR
jgi:Fic family protein